MATYAPPPGTADIFEEEASEWRFLENAAREVFSRYGYGELRNFGVFEIKVRKERKGRNPNKPQDVVKIPERAVVKFRAGKELKEAVEKLDTAKIK